MSRYNLWLQQGSYPGSVDRRAFSAIWGPVPASYGLLVSPSTAMTLNIAAGAIAVPTNNNTGSCLCVSDATETVTVTAAPGAGTSRIDVVVAQARGNDLDGGSNNDVVFFVVAGVASASPAAPTVPANAAAIAQVLVASGTAAITAGMITDVRPHGMGPELALQAGNPFSSYTDPYGELWVSKGGVNGGAWRKARDVLFCNVGRSAGLTVTPTAALVAWDNAQRDSYGLWNGGSTITIPVAGMYLVTTRINVTASATGQNCLIQLLKNGGVSLTGPAPNSSLASWLQPTIAMPSLYAAGDALTVQVATAPAGTNLPLAQGNQSNLFSVSYMGTG